MKKAILIPAIAATVISFAACGSNSASKAPANNDSSSSNMTKIPDNSAATNPSLADTLYSNDSTSIKKDSIKKK